LPIFSPINSTNAYSIYALHMRCTNAFIGSSYINYFLKGVLKKIIAIIFLLYPMELLLDNAFPIMNILSKTLYYLTRVQSYFQKSFT